MRMRAAISRPIDNCRWASTMLNHYTRTDKKYGGLSLSYEDVGSSSCLSQVVIEYHRKVCAFVPSETCMSTVLYGQSWLPHGIRWVISYVQLYSCSQCI